VELIEPDADLPGSQSPEQSPEELTPTDDTPEQWLTPEQVAAEDVDELARDGGDDLGPAAAFPPPSGGDNGGYGGGGSGGDGGDHSLGGEPAGAGSEAPAPPRARWARSEDRVVGGVGGGLGDALGLDPLIVRLAFVAVTALSAAGIPAYLAGWLLLRPDPYAPPVSGFRKIAGVVLAGISVIGILSNDGPIFGGNVLLAALLIGVAFAIWGPRKLDGVGVDWRSSAEAAQENLRGAVSNLRQGATNGASGVTQAQPATDWVPRLRKVRKPPSPLGRFGFLAALIGGIVTYLFGGRDAEAATWGFSVAAAICAVALIIGMFWGRARWLVFPGLLALGGAGAADAVHWAGAPWATSGIEGYAQPTSAEDVRPSYRYGSVDYTLDLSQITDDVTTKLSGAVGEITVYVPPTARVEVVARVGLGNIDFSGDGTNNFGRHDSQTLSFGPEGGNRIMLDLSVGIGGISVVRNAAPDDTIRPVVTAPPVSQIPLPVPPSQPVTVAT
jgi:phage shock protein PspC (stress-responsive transcriptional regulator)